MHERAIGEYFSMWVRRDFSRFDELFSPECVYEECYGPVYVGTDELHHWIDHMLSHQTVTAWDIRSIEPDQNGEALFVSWTLSAAEDKDYTFDGISRIHYGNYINAELCRELKVSLIVSRYAHDRSGTVAHKHVV